MSSHVLIDHVGNTCAHHGPRCETGVRTALWRWEIRFSGPRWFLFQNPQIHICIHFYSLPTQCQLLRRTSLPRVSTRLLTNFVLLYLVIKVQEMDQFILRLSGNTLAVAVPERTVGRDELSEDDGLSSVPLLPRWSDGVCERNTGGTCFFSGCLSSRKNLCVATWGLRTLPWHSCRCREHQCAHMDGGCHDRPMPGSVASWLRAESFSKVLMMIVLVGRSGVDGFIMSVTGLDRLTIAHEKIVIDYMEDRLWEGQRQQQELRWHQAVITSAVKFVFTLGKSSSFWTAWFACKDLMSWGSVLLSHDRRAEGGRLLREPAARNLLPSRIFAVGTLQRREQEDETGVLPEPRKRRRDDSCC